MDAPKNRASQYDLINPVYKAYGGILAFHIKYLRGEIDPLCEVEDRLVEDAVSPTWLILARYEIDTNA